MPRYKYNRVIDNKSEYYRFLREKREVHDNIIHSATPILHTPTMQERANIKTDTHVWSYGDRFYNLAHKYYGDVSYWWVIALYNGYPTEVTIKAGNVIYIPLDLDAALTALQMY